MENHQAETINVVKELSGISCSMEMPSYSLVSRKLLKIYSEKKKVTAEQLNQKKGLAKHYNHHQVSTADIMKMARAKLLQSASQNSDAIYMPGSVFLDHSGISTEDMENIELALWLQDCARKVTDQDFNRARRLLKMCGCDAPQTGNTVQRIVYYFAEALKEKIDRDMGVILRGREYEKPLDAEKVLTRQLHAMFSLKNKLPLSSITHLTGIQLVLDNVVSATKIHLIDMGIKSGSHFTVLFQSLAARKECPVEHLKITVVGTSRARLEWIGKQLLSFARNIKAPFQFSFKVIESDMKDLKEEYFGLENGEVVAVYCSLRLWSMLAFPGHIEVLLGVIKKLNPCIMVVSESEVKTSQLCFLDRFNEYLVHASALFDCIHTCLGQDDESIRIAEGALLGEIIKNVVAAEGEERIYRHENINFWRDLFSRFNIVEAELSSLSWYQANLVPQMSSNWIHCNLEMSGQCLIMKWKGVPLSSISAWKFENGGELNGPLHESSLVEFQGT